MGTSCGWERNNKKKRSKVITETYNEENGNQPLSKSNNTKNGKNEGKKSIKKKEDVDRKIKIKNSSNSRSSKTNKNENIPKKNKIKNPKEENKDEIKNSKEEKKEKSYLDFNINDIYYIVCPDCKNNSPNIEKINYDLNKKDFKIFYTCECQNIQKDSYLIDFINKEPPKKSNKNFISIQDINKILSDAREEKNEFKGLEFIEKLFQKYSIKDCSFVSNKSVAPLFGNKFNNSNLKEIENSKNSNIKISNLNGNIINYSKNIVYSQNLEVSNLQPGKSFFKNINNMPVINEEIDHKYNCFKTIEVQPEILISLIKLESDDFAAGSKDAKIFIWNVEQSKCIKTIQEIGQVLCLLEFEKNKLLSGTSENNISLWDLNSNENNFYFLGHELWVTSLVKCNDKIFASSSNDRTIRIWDYYGRKLIKTIEAHEDCILSMIKLKNGNLCSAGNDFCIKIWDWEQGICLYEIPCSNKIIRCLCQLDDETLLSGSDDNIIKIWKNNELYNQLEGHKDKIRTLCKIDENYFASGSFDNTIKIWDIKNLNCFQTLNDHSLLVTCILKLKDNSLVSCSFDKTIKIWKND